MNTFYDQFGGLGNAVRLVPIFTLLYLVFHLFWQYIRHIIMTNKAQKMKIISSV